MKPGYGSRKGSSFERKISKELSLWWTDGKSDGCFWRTHSSGALGTRSKKPTEYGDLMSISDVGQPFTKRFHLELRHGKCIRIQDLVYSPKASSSNMTGFIEEGIRGAKASGRVPLWIFREQGKPVMIMLLSAETIFYMNTDQNISVNHAIEMYLPKIGIMVMTFDNFKKYFNKRKLNG